MATEIILIAQCTNRQKCTVTGRVASITLPASSAQPSVTAVLRDSSGTLIITWLGRKDIGGLHVDAHLEVTGIVSQGSGHPQMINPRYSVIPTPATAVEQRG